VPITSRTPSGFIQIIHLFPVYLFVAGNHHLGNPVAGVYFKRLIAVIYQ
jgi:hypothetical protein